MKERPILFSAPMVRALLAGTKTQTRRMVSHRHRAQIDLSHGGRVANWSKPMPYGQPGDRLWVRETWAYGIHAMDSKYPETEGPWVYAADNPQAHERLCDRWRPSIHMFRPASRITLEINGVRVERLQDISDQDARAEGIYPTATGLYQGAPRAAFQKLWESINGPGSWNANPWVWVVTFERITP